MAGRKRRSSMHRSWPPTGRKGVRPWGCWRQTALPNEGCCGGGQSVASTRRREASGGWRQMVLPKGKVKGGHRCKGVGHRWLGVGVLIGKRSLRGGLLEKA
ncbi:hypothetical protein OIU78_016999 [Salix suchowensis]|nr:hypothetical protein OIU78_016999 [Salix suchowensis]